MDKAKPDYIQRFSVDLARVPAMPVLLRGQRTIHPMCGTRKVAGKRRIAPGIPCELPIGNRGEDARMITTVDAAYATLEANRTLLRPYKQVSGTGCAGPRDVFALAHQHDGALAVGCMACTGRRNEGIKCGGGGACREEFGLQRGRSVAFGPSRRR